MSVNELFTALKLTQPLTSAHLILLYEGNILNKIRAGKSVVYFINYEILEKILAFSEESDIARRKIKDKKQKHV